MSSSPDFGKLVSLLGALREGSISDLQLEELPELVAGSPEAREIYLEHTFVIAALRWTYSNELPAKGSSPSHGVPSSQQLPLSDRGRILGFDMLSARFIGLAASLVLVGYFVVLMGMIVWDRAHPNQRQPDRTFAHHAAGGATLFKQYDCQWEDSVPVAAGDRLVNRTLRLRQGLAEVKFDQGASVFVEGPAEFEVRSANDSFLHHGKLVARVPSQAIGFTVATPTAEVIDLGTEFGVEVDVQKRTEVHVIRGRVQLLPAGATASTQRGETLHAGQARRVVGTTGKGATTIATEQLRFDAARFALKTRTKTALERRDRERQIAAARRPATLLLHYDFDNPNSWNGVTLADLQGFGASLKPERGAPRNVKIDTITVTPANFGAPVVVASGASSLVRPPAGFQARQRAFLNFTMFGILDGPLTNRDQNIFETGSAGNANVGGYTLEGFFLMHLGYLALENSGIGFAQSADGENQLIRVPRGTNGTLSSNSMVDSAAGNPQNFEQVTANVYIPRNQWFHFVKVHDPVVDEVRFYIDGVLQPESTQRLDPDNSGIEYHPVRIKYGNVGSVGRELIGIGFSMTRVYRGVLTDAEILANFQEVAFVPIPGKAGPATQRGSEDTE